MYDRWVVGRSPTPCIKLYNELSLLILYQYRTLMVATISIIVFGRDSNPSSLESFCCVFLARSWWKLLVQLVDVSTSSAGIIVTF